MAKKHKHEEHENHERWLVSYADFITLLFAFFVILYATSQQDEKKEKEFEESIRQYMTGMSGTGIQKNFSQGMGETSVIDSAMPKFPSQSSDSDALEKVVSKMIKDKLSDKEYDDLVSEVKSDELGVRIELYASTLFDSGSVELKNQGLIAFDKLARVLRASHRKIIVEGHTDDRPIHTAQYPSNWELASMRATKMVRYLISKHRLDPSTLSATSFGDQRPVRPNTSEENRAKNRRIEIVVLNKDIGL